MLERIIDELSFAKFKKDLKDAIKCNYMIKFTDAAYAENELGIKTERIILVVNKNVLTYDYKNNKEIKSVIVDRIYLNINFIYRIADKNNISAKTIAEVINAFFNDSKNLSRLYYYNPSINEDLINALIKK